MKDLDIENIIRAFVEFQNAFEHFIELAQKDESFELSQTTLPNIYSAIHEKKHRESDLILSKFTQNTYTQFSADNFQGNFEEYWLKTYDLFILQEVEQVIMESDYYLSRARLLTWIILKKSPSNLYDVYIKLIKVLTKTYTESRTHKVINIVYFLEQLMDYIWGFDEINDVRLIPCLAEICYLEIEDKSQISFDYLKKTLSVLSTIGTKESLLVIKDFLNHEDTGVSKMAQKLYNYHNRKNIASSS